MTGTTRSLPGARPAAGILSGRALAALIALLLAFMTAARAQEAEEGEPEESGDEPLEVEAAPERGEGSSPGFDPLEWVNVRGVNYVPGGAPSPYQAWLSYSPERVRLDLARARKTGFNSVRVILSSAAQEEKPKEFSANWADFVGVCREEGLSVMPVLFDSWGAEVPMNRQIDLVSGGYGFRDLRRETALQAFEKFLSRPDAYRIDPKTYERRLGWAAKRDPERPVLASIDPSAAFWGEWFPSPPRERFGKGNWPRFAEYVKACVEPFKDDLTIAAWDVMNEPDAMRIFDQTPPDPNDAYDFVRGMAALIRETGTSRPLTVGAAGGWAGARVFQRTADVVSLHKFSGSPGELAAEIREARKRGKPVVVSAAGANLFPAKAEDAGDEAQLRLVSALVPRIEAAGAGYYLWSLREDKGPAPWTGLLRADGTPKPAAQWLKSRSPAGEDPVRKLPLPPR